MSKTKCVLCKGLKKDPTKSDAHCLECLHCEDHCHSFANPNECQCCCGDEHCIACICETSDDCDLFDCDCCCNTHCITCGHVDKTQCEKSESAMCQTCCACNKISTSRLDPLQADANKDWIKLLKAPGYSSKINGSLLGNRDITTDIGLFYLLLSYGDSKVSENHNKKLAKRILNYLLISTMGEARHVLSMGTGNIKDLSKEGQAICVSVSRSSNLSNRYTMWNASYALAEEFGYDKVLYCIFETFSKVRWRGGGYGGIKWAKIAELAWQYAKGDFNEVIFIDGIMNIVHNGGWAFNKYYISQSSKGNRISISGLLDFKREATMENIYSLLLFMGIPEKTDTEKKLWKKARELGVLEKVKGENVLTKKYKGLTIKVSSSMGVKSYNVASKKDNMNIESNKILVPSVAFQEFLEVILKEGSSV